MADQEDLLQLYLYRIAWGIITGLGLIGALMIIMSEQFQAVAESMGGFIGSDPQAFITTIGQPLVITLIGLFLAALLVGFLQVVLTAKIGEEVILLVVWATPFVIIAFSIFAYLQNDQNTNTLFVGLFGVGLLAFIYWARSKIRLSARLVEKAAEVVASNPSMFKPQLYAGVLVVIAGNLWMFGIVPVFYFSFQIHPYLTVFTIPVHLWIYAFTLNGARAFADAHNIAYAHDWYSNEKGEPNYDKASNTVSQVRGAVARYAFLMTFVRMFKRRRSSGISGSLSSARSFFSRGFVTRLLSGRGLFGSSSVSSAVAGAIEYLGKYTLVIVVVKRMRSVTEAFKESTRTVFRTFITTAGGAVGLEIIESLRKWLSIILLMIAGAIYGYFFPDIAGLENVDQTARIIWAIIMGIIFLFIGGYPVNIMFGPVSNTFNVLLYDSYSAIASGAKPSKKLDKKTRDLILEVFRK